MSWPISKCLWLVREDGFSVLRSKSLSRDRATTDLSQSFLPEWLYRSDQSALPTFSVLPENQHDFAIRVSVGMQAELEDSDIAGLRDPDAAFGVVGVEVCS
jgi:hypothetical protein